MSLARTPGSQMTTSNDSATSALRCIVSRGTRAIFSRACACRAEALLALARAPGYRRAVTYTLLYEGFGINAAGAEGTEHDETGHRRASL
jgi:hypothetical protein